MNIIDKIRYALISKETTFYKEDNDLQNKYDALIKLNMEYPDNKKIEEELKKVKIGLDGENEIVYELKKSNIGMYVLKDVKIEYKDLKAQIDFVVITPIFTYYIECKNLSGNIIIDSNGNFIRQYKDKKESIYSPLTQVENQREVLRKIWEKSTGKITKLFASEWFNYYRKVLVVIANKHSILSTYKAPINIKDKIIKSDSLTRKIENDIHNCNNEDYVYSRKKMEELAQTYLELCVKENIDFYEYYYNKFVENINDDELKERLILFRKNKAKEMGIPAYYVFTNEELDKMLKVKPKTIEELYSILPEIKVKTHGNNIIEEINRN